MRIFVYGAGRCGRTLARALAAAGHELVGTWNRTAASARADLGWPAYHGAQRPPALDAAEVVWVTVPDRAIAGAARAALGPDHVALHAAGAVPASVLRVAEDRPRAVAACHPIQSFADALSPPDHVRGIAFGVQGEPEACAVAERLVASLGASALRFADEDAKALYHAACCVASNALVALADRAVALFAAAGVPRPEALAALAPLILGTARNLAGAEEAVAVLTGPVARGDVAVVRGHLRAIRGRVPQEAEHYRHITREILRLAPDSAVAAALAEDASVSGRAAPGCEGPHGDGDTPPPRRPDASSTD